MIKIFIDPGHGGADPGAVGNGLREKDLTLSIGKKIRDKLKNYENVSVQMSRDRDVFLSLSTRAKKANDWGADYFISIHINSASGKNGTGFESFIYNGKVSQKTISNQKALQAEILKLTKFKDRGMKRANFGVLRLTNMPAILTENGFINNPSDAARLKQDSFLDQIAQGHVNGLVKTYGLKVKQGTSSSSTEKQPTSNTNEKVTNASGNSVVKSIQTWLNKNYNGKLVVDGIPGPETKKALVKAYQTELNKQFKRGLAVDGIPGQKTFNAAVNVYPGAKGNLTRVLQSFLYCLGYRGFTVNGVFDQNTSEAVRSFQRQNGLVVDSIAGKNTWRKILQKNF